MRSVHLYMTLALVSAPLISCYTVDEPDDEEGVAKVVSPFSQQFSPEIEPNANAMTATPITAVGLGSIAPLTDHDFYSFQATAGDRVYLMTSSLFSVNGATDMDLNVRGTDGTTLIEDDDQNGTFGQFSPVIAGATIAATGTNFIDAQYFLDGNRTQPYQLHFAKQSGLPAPEAEPNDTNATANALNAAGFAGGALSAAADVDVYAISVNAGDTVFAALDLDPERDGTETAGNLSIGPFNGANFTVNDSGGFAGPEAEGLVATIKTAGTYFIAVAGSGAGTYQLSVTKTAQATPPGACATYTSTDIPKTIATGPGKVTSTITVPGNPRIADLDVSINLTHGSMADLDVQLLSPKGNSGGLFTDIGTAAQTAMDLTLDDEAAFPVGFNPIVSGFVLQPENAYRLAWFDGEDAGGVWTLTIDDDLANGGGTLNGWSITVCEPAAPAACGANAYPVTLLTSDFEASDGGFTHAGTADQWARGLPSGSAITDCNQGTGCFKTNLAGNYAASSAQTLITAPLVLTNIVAPIRASWAQKYQMDSSLNDRVTVDVEQVGGGAPSARLFENINASMTSTFGNPTVTLQEVAGWGVQTADISAFAGQTVELGFRLTSDALTQLAGFAVDDVSVVGCRVNLCGDGVTFGGETCDDGNLTNGDGCDANCTVTACGNGIATMGEACDDGNTTEGDGCDSNCTATACGNMIVTAGETCDDGNTTDGDGCDSDCSVTACGNGILTTGEGCDDDNTTDGDGCDSNCTVTACGNTIVTAGEDCDDGNTVAGDGCSDTCQTESGTSSTTGATTTTTATSSGAAMTTSSGTTSSSSSGAGGGGGGGGAEPTGGGCSCSVPGTPSNNAELAPLALLGLAAIRRLRKRSS